MTDTRTLLIVEDDAALARTLGRSFERRPAFQRREKALENLRCIGNGKTGMRNHRADFHAGTTGRTRFRNRRRFPVSELVQRMVEGHRSILSCKA